MDSNQPNPRRSFLKGALATPLVFASSAVLAHAKPDAASTGVGPSTTTQPYLLPSITGAKTVSILTVGDSVGGYRMVGIPDGLGAFNSGHKQFTLLMNHEITSGTPGIVRAHGSNGAFVSRWTINTDTLKVVKGQDHTPSADKVFLWDPATRQVRAGHHAVATALLRRSCGGERLFGAWTGYARSHLPGRRRGHRGPRLGEDRFGPPHRRSLAIASPGPHRVRERRCLSVSRSRRPWSFCWMTAISAPRRPRRRVLPARSTSTSEPRPAEATRSRGRA